MSKFNAERAKSLAYVQFGQMPAAATGDWIVVAETAEINGLAREGLVSLALMSIEQHERILAATPGPSSKGVPDGWKLVPRIPTQAMRMAFHESFERYEDGEGECPDSQWRAMLSAVPTSPALDEPSFAIPDMDQHLLEILGRPCFACSPIASVLRLGGAEIRRKAEIEQAVVIHWMLTLYLQHGAGWKEAAQAEIERICAEHPAKPEAGA